MAVNINREQVMKASKWVLFFMLVGFVSCWPLYGQSTDSTLATPFKPALLVIDIQNVYLPMMDQKEVAPAMEAINTLIDVFRQNNYPIVRVYHHELGQDPAPGTAAFAFPNTVNINEGDAQIIKNYPSAFQKTDLDNILKSKGVNSLYLCGLSATGCVLATYFGALEREYDVVMVKEAVMSNKADYTDMIRRITGAWNLSFVRVGVNLLAGNMRILETMSNKHLVSKFGISAAADLNAMGYYLLSKNRLVDAIAVLKTNARLYPDEANCFDSLGEALELNGQKDLALANYEKAFLKAKEKNDPNLAIFEKNYKRLQEAKK
jgi:nicotinamidase-related amidase